MTTQRVHNRINKGIYHELEFIKEAYEIETGQYISLNKIINLACSHLIEDGENLEYIKKNKDE